MKGLGYLNSNILFRIPRLHFFICQLFLSLCLNLRVRTTFLSLKKIYLKVLVFHNYFIQLNLVFLFCKSKCFLGLSKALTKLACLSENFTKPSGEFQNVQFSQGQFSPMPNGKLPLGNYLILFQGPPVVTRIRRELNEILEKEGFDNISQEIFHSKTLQYLVEFKIKNHI